jgi:small-conductance mechanosensitive channel
MKVLWTLLKVVITLVVAIPVSIIVLATALGILGALVGIAVLALKVAVFGLVGWAAFRLVARLLRGPSRDTSKSRMAELPPVDPHYEAAMRELDRELGPVAR